MLLLCHFPQDRNVNQPRHPYNSVGFLLSDGRIIPEDHADSSVSLFQQIWLPTSGWEFFTCQQGHDAQKISSEFSNSEARPYFCKYCRKRGIFKIFFLLHYITFCGSIISKVRLWPFVTGSISILHLLHYTCTITKEFGLCVTRHLPMQLHRSLTLSEHYIGGLI